MDINASLRRAAVVFGAVAAVTLGGAVAASAETQGISEAPGQAISPVPGDETPQHIFSNSQIELCSYGNYSSEVLFTNSTTGKSLNSALVGQGKCAIFNIPFSVTSISLYGKYNTNDSQFYIGSMGSSDVYAHAGLTLATLGTTTAPSAEWGISG